MAASGTVEYGKREYWDSRYEEDPEPFDWYQRYDSLKDLINQFCPQRPSARTLIVGCGNSTLSEDMYQDGYTAIVSCDISPVVISSMRALHPHLQFEVMDVTNMNTLEAASFDYVLDKGTLDAILCGEGSTTNAEMMMSEISRILKPNGCFMEITYGAPKYRMSYLEHDKYSWEVTRRTIEKPNSGEEGEEDAQKDVHYVYCMQKKA